MASRVGEVKTALSIHHDRRVFLEAISRVCPEFWQDLRANVLPNFPDIPARAIRRGYRDRIFAPIQAAFGKWLTRFHIESVVWLQVVALQTLRAWKEHPSLTSFTLNDSYWAPETITLNWEPDIETSDQLIQRAKEQVAEVRKANEKCPLPLSERDAEWLALHQFLGLSRYEIQRRERERNVAIGGEGEASICAKGWKVAADRLGITPRKLPRGRPKKHSTNT